MPESIGSKRTWPLRSAQRVVSQSDERRSALYSTSHIRFDGRDETLALFFSKPSSGRGKLCFAELRGGAPDEAQPHLDQLSRARLGLVREASCEVFAIARGSACLRNVKESRTVRAWVTSCR